MSTSADGTGPHVVKLSKAQIKLIRSSPIHRKIKRSVYSILAASLLGGLSTLVVVVLSCILAGNLVRRDQRWLIVHYTIASIFSALWPIYCGFYYSHVKFAAWSDQLKIDGASISFVVIFSSCFLFYLFYKLYSLATLESIGEDCIFDCESDLQFVRLSPLIVGITNLFLLAFQLYLLVLLFRNPIVNPPLDEHGMPKPINPLNGEVMPMGADGEPILPPELRPIPDTKDKTKKGKEQSEKGNDNETEGDSGDSDRSSISGSDDEGDEKTLLKEDPNIKKEAWSKELGKSSRRTLAGQRQSRRTGYNVV
ncbi:hypothetical protein JCM16303_000399 [Sporobolomyces ruberrimus]